ncbi:ArnT family glycosyltransferase [Rhodanobacter hydrolyticus]|uniref:Glycosyltransferase family 39 protein n=1 Tax=Rhodanobacter hydrolyticus TaxID=2250595 RepID=A0ABW8J3I0_9GAMM
MTGSVDVRVVSRSAAALRPSQALLWIVALGLLLGFAFQGSRGLWGPDEGRYVDAALQMLDSGNYMVPSYSPAELNFSKPPLTYWVIAGSMQLFGRNTWAARLPYALAYLATLLVLFAMGRKVCPYKPWLPPLVYATSIFTFLTSNIISTDVLLTFAEGLAALGYMMFAWPGSASESRHGRWLMWLGFGLAFLTKGPPGLLPLLAIIAFTVLCEGWRAVGRLFAPAGLLVFLVVGFTWYALAISRYPWLFHYFIHDEVYGRIFTHMYVRHSGAFGWILVYAPVLIFGSLPWWGGAAGAVRAAASPSSWRMWRATHSIHLFLLLWVAIPFVIFCLAKSRLPLYLLPLFLPLALLVASRMAPTFDLALRRNTLLLAAWLVVLLVIKALPAHGYGADIDDGVGSREVAATTAGIGYRALVFVERATDGYAIEEQTPWGMRLYLDKPVYGVRWMDADAAMQICGAIKAQGQSLLLVDHTIPRRDLDDALGRCRASITPVGAWRKDLLFVAGI